MLWGPQEEPPSLARGFWDGFLEEMRPELSLEEHGSVSPVKKRGRASHKGNHRSKDLVGGTASGQFGIARR